MKIEPNILLAITASLAMALVTGSAVYFAAPGKAIQYVGAALMSVAGFLVLNAAFMAWRKRKPKPMIDRSQPVTMIMAMVFPFTMILSAALPMLTPGMGDYGLMIIIGGVFTGLAIQSAIAVLRQTA